MMPTHGARNAATVADLAGQVSAGGAGGAEGSFVSWHGHCCRLLLYVLGRAHDCGWRHLWAAGAHPCRKLRCPVAVGSSSYGPGAAVCTLLRV